MTPDDTGDIEWIERDAREWVLFANQPDQLTARMTCTYLETGGVEARVATHGGLYCVEVPTEQLEMAYTVYQPVESGVLPAMQEETSKTGIHTGRFLREQLAKQAEPETREDSSIGKWLLRVVVIAILVALLLLLFAT